MTAKAKTEASAKTTNGDISVRPPSDARAIPGFFIFLGVLLPIVFRLPGGTPPNPLPWPAVLAVGAAFFVPGVLMGTWLNRLRVTASDTGLCWRKWFKQTETPWAEIGDFYVAPFERRRTRENSEAGLYPDLRVLDTKGRTVAAFSSRFRNADALKERIAERATNAKPRAWATKGTHPFDPLPRVFTYKTRENRFLPIFFFGQGIVLFIAVVTTTVDMVQRSLARNDFGWWTIGAAVTFSGIGGLMGLLIFLVIKGHKHNLGTGERFIVDADGFTFCAGSHFERVLWKNVTGYGYAPRKPGKGPFKLSLVPPFRIETREQGAFDFTYLIGDVPVLREIIRVNAVSANQTDWPTPPTIPDEPLGDTGLQWSGGVEGVGERIFHYRTASSRAFLWLAALPTGAALLIAVFAQFGLTRDDANPQTAYTVSAFLALLFAWAVWRYYAAQIRVGEAGITQKTPWGQTHIAWADVQTVSIKASDPFGAKIVGKNKRVIRWTNGFLAGETELRSLLAERVPSMQDAS